MVIAWLDTPHFVFRAAGATREDALAALRRGWAIHAARTGADPDYFIDDDVSSLDLEPGDVYRDETKLVVPAEPPGPHTSPPGPVTVVEAECFVCRCIRTQERSHDRSTGKTYLCCLSCDTAREEDA